MELVFDGMKSLRRMADVGDCRWQVICIEHRWAHDIDFDCAELTIQKRDAAHTKRKIEEGVGRSWITIQAEDFDGNVLLCRSSSWRLSNCNDFV